MSSSGGLVQLTKVEEIFYQRQFDQLLARSALGSLTVTTTTDSTPLTTAAAPGPLDAPDSIGVGQSLIAYVLYIDCMYA